MTVDRSEQIAEVIDHWPALRDLAEFATKRHGFGDSNGGFGVIYPDDLDEFDREADGVNIPGGHVQIYGYWGATRGGFEFVVSEAEYLSVLHRKLREARLALEADAVQFLSGKA